MSSLGDRKPVMGVGENLTSWGQRAGVEGEEARSRLGVLRKLFFW